MIPNISISLWEGHIKPTHYIITICNLQMSNGLGVLIFLHGDHGEGVWED
jgi:hypothetical protein